MSYLPGFEDDIFISYAHIDNVPLTPGQQGWISNFHRCLEIRLSQLLGASPEFWRDEREVRGNDFFADKIIGHLPKIAVFVSVITPRYAKSDWCRKEIQEFCKIAEQTGGVRVKNKSRIFKIVKTPVEPDQEPPEVQELLGYDFYVKDERGRLREFDPALESKTDENYYRYYQVVSDLAQDIRELLCSLLSPRSCPEPSRATVYLAETTSELKDTRDNVRRDLQQRGYAVLPDRPLPTNGAEFRSAVQDYLRRSALSVHLVGENYGWTPEAESRSHVRLQNELAAERSRDGGFNRLIWLPVGLKTSNQQQQEFLETLERDSNAQSGAELLQTPIEELKTLIKDKLASSGKEETKPSTAGPLRIYLSCDRSDIESGAVAPIEDYLYSQGYEPILPVLADDEAQVREDNTENLRLCHACLIYYGAASDAWVRFKLNDVRKIRYERREPMLATAIYVAGPETEPKHRFRTNEFLVIRNFETFSSSSLSPFFAAIRQAQGNKP